MRAKKWVNYVKKLLDKIGIGGERIEMFNLSAAMGPKFAEIANSITERIKKLGTNPLKSNPSWRQAKESGGENLSDVKNVGMFHKRYYFEDNL